MANGLQGRIDQKQLYIVRGPHNEDSSDFDDLRTKSPALARGIIKCKKTYSVADERRDVWTNGPGKKKRNEGPGSWAKVPNSVHGSDTNVI